MLWYLIKYNQSLWSLTKTFTQLSSAEEYKKLMEERNKSTCKYMIVCSPQGVKYLPQIVEWKLNQSKVEAA